VSRPFSTRATKGTIDLATVRDTLLYIEHDLRASDEYERLANAVHRALDEVARLEAKARSLDVPSAVTGGAHFMPVDL
jgi:hypothetical protein